MRARTHAGFALVILLSLAAGEAAARSGGYGDHGYDPAADCAQSLELFRRG